KEIEALRQFKIRIAVITNSSLLWKEDVRDDLKKADLVSLKIDTVNKKIWKNLNRPVEGISIDKILEGIKKFASVFNGAIITETLLVKEINDSPETVKETALFISDIKPSTAYIGIPTRPPAEIWALPPQEKKLLDAYEIFTIYGIKTELITGSGSGRFGFTGKIEEDIVNTVSVHPMSKTQIEELLKKAGKCWDVVEGLLKKGEVKEIEYQGEKYYIKNFSK
ncbi:MAG: radical SAM protein, partial [Candidatus Omnitrophica bacterium]|nr:radical SAM protein [Candidatus Omnitrophota bacterium]